MRIMVMGAGGVGGYFGARLAQAGHEVAFIARGRHLEALRTKGIALKSALGDAELKVKAFEKPSEAGAADAVLFAVKLWDTESAAEAIKPALKAGGVVIPFQNGVESIERLSKVLGPKPVLGGSAYIAARIEAPGVIRHTGNFARLLFGPVTPDQRPAAEAFAKACVAAGIEASVADDIARVNWEKFVYLVGISGVCSIARSALGVVRTDPDLRRLLSDTFRETWAVGRKRGIGLTDEFLGKMLEQADSFPAEMKPSMLGDLEAGGRLEAPWLCGAVVRMGGESGVEVPANRAIYAALKPFIAGRG